MEPTVLNILIAFCGLAAIVYIINWISEDCDKDLPPTWPFY